MLALLLFAIQLAATPGSSQLPPSEALSSAMAPFNAARAQADDLTTADNIALGVGIAHASRDCLSLTAKQASYANNAPELLALGKLCLFGQQYEAARTAAVQYMASTEIKDHELPLLMLVSAFMGLGAPGSAVPQVRSLLLQFPYDAQIHLALDQVIDATAGATPEFNQLALEMCGKQNAVTLPLLTGGHAISGKDASVSADTLFGDAVRCMTLARATGDVSAAGTLEQLQNILDLPAWQASAEQAPMQEALARTKMVGRAAPFTVLQGKVLLANGTLEPRSVSLAHGKVLLIPFALWSPSVVSILQTLILSAPQQNFYAITSWAANTGSTDAPNNNLLLAMRDLRKSLPAHTALLVVPDAELKALHADTFPAGVVVRDGKVAANAPLTGKAWVRLVLLGLHGEAAR